VAWRGVAWRGVAWRGVAWRGVAWRGVAWRGVAWRGVAWRGVARRGVAWRGVAWRGVAWRGVAWRGVAWRGVAWRGAGCGGVLRFGAVRVRTRRCRCTDTRPALLHTMPCCCCRRCTALVARSPLALATGKFRAAAQTLRDVGRARGVVWCCRSCCCCDAGLGVAVAVMQGFAVMLGALPRTAARGTPPRGELAAACLRVPPRDSRWWHW
jgi:hypothetical protein